MTGISISAELRAQEARQRLHELVQRMEDKRPFFEDVGQALAESSRANFMRQAGPDGTRWRPLKRQTIKARERLGQIPIQILRARGRLAGSINYVATDDEVRIGSPDERAAIHQLGGTIEKPARAAKIYRLKDKDGKVGRRFVKKADADVVTDVTIPAHKITIPARPFIGISADDEELIFILAERWLAP